MLLPWSRWRENKHCTNGHIKGGSPGLVVMEDSSPRSHGFESQQLDATSIFSHLFVLINKTKKGLSRPLFLYFRLFNTIDSKIFNIIFCQWLDSNCGPLDLEATALSTESQPLSYLFRCFKRPKINVKEAGIVHFLQKKVKFSNKWKFWIKVSTISEKDKISVATYE